MAAQYKEDVKIALQNNDQAQAAQKAKEYLGDVNKVPLIIGITGESGSGKSTLVNALRGIPNGEEGAAPIGVVETTMNPTKYIHPQNDKIIIWDLPGIGTPKFKAAKYLKDVGFEKYDFFMIVSDKRFRENDAKLAKKIQKMKKKFYFVRSQIDHDISSQKQCYPNIDEETVLKQIRDNCTKELQKLGCESPKVFLVSGLHLDLYEFKDLWLTLEKNLPKLQRDALLLALPNISQDVIEQKKEALEKKIKWYALRSAASAAVPFPGFSFCVDMVSLVEFSVLCQNSLGLRLESLQKLSNVSRVSLEELKAETKSLLAAVEIKTALVVKALASSAPYLAEEAVKEGAKYIPGIGTFVAITVSSVTTYRALSYILDTMSKDAQRVFMKALGLKTYV